MKKNIILETADCLLQMEERGDWKEFLLHVLEVEKEGPTCVKNVSVLAMLETKVRRKAPESETEKLVRYILFHAVEQAFGKEAQCRQVERETGRAVCMALRHGLEIQQVEERLEEVFASLNSELGFVCRAAVCHGIWGEDRTEEGCREAESLLLAAAPLSGSGLFHWEDIKGLVDISYEPEPEQVKTLLELLHPALFREEALNDFAGEMLGKLSSSRFSHPSICRAFETLIRAVFLEIDEDLWEQSGSSLAREAQKDLKECRTIREFQETFRIWLQKTATVLERANLSEGMKIVSRIKSRIRTEYSQNLKLSTFASEYYMNQSYLSVLFQQETGKSFSQYLTEVRLRKAKELLETTTFPTRKIAELVGYNDRNYFAAVFSKHEGQTPMQYRKALKI